MDFDGDGRADILSGSYTPGDLYLFRGLGSGKFARGVTLKDRSGTNLKPGAASTVFAFDWTGSGRLDLLVGNIDGDVMLYRNEGSTGGPAYGKPEKILAAGKPIKPAGGDTHPIAADWDDDGRPDLLLGADDGSVTWYRNTGSRGEPSLAAGVVLVPKSKMHNDFAGTAGTQPTRGIRSKICVTDWNGDGQSDLLVGDYTYSRAEPPRLTVAQRAKRDKARKTVQGITKELMVYSEEMEKLGRQPSGEAERKAWMDRAGKIETRFRPVMDRYAKAHQQLEKYEGAMQSDGFVWLFVRSNATARAR